MTDMTPVRPPPPKTDATEQDAAEEAEAKTVEAPEAPSEAPPAEPAPETAPVKARGTDDGRRAAAEVRTWARKGAESAQTWDARVRDGEIVAFQPHALSVENRPVPRWARAPIYVILIIVATLLTWSALATMDVTVTARGKIVADKPNVVLQPLETAVIRGIHVEVGDTVEAGQVVADLDPTFSGADLAQVQERRAGLLAQMARVRAMLEGRPYAPAPPLDPYQEIQKTVYDHQTASLEADLTAKRAEIAALVSHRATLEEDQRQYRAQLATVREQETMYDTLVGEGVGSKVSLLGTRLRRQEIERSLAATANQLQRVFDDTAKAEAEMNAMVQRADQRLAEELMQVSRDLSAAEEDLNKARRRRDMVTLTAPEAGTVLSVADLSVGSVVRSAEPVASLVPRSASYLAEVRIPAEDIRDITVGTPVRVKMDAYPFQNFGVMTGEVKALAGDAQVNRDAQGQAAGGAYYTARIALNVNEADPRITLIPGMGVTGELRTGDRTILSYFLYPVLRMLDESFRGR